MLTFWGKLRKEADPDADSDLEWWKLGLSEDIHPY